MPSHSPPVATAAWRVCAVIDLNDSLRPTNRTSALAGRTPGTTSRTGSSTSARKPSIGVTRRGSSSGVPNGHARADESSARRSSAVWSARYSVAPPLAGTSGQSTQPTAASSSRPAATRRMWSRPGESLSGARTTARPLSGSSAVADGLVAAPSVPRAETPPRGPRRRPSPLDDQGDGVRRPGRDLFGAVQRQVVGSGPVQADRPVGAIPDEGLAAGRCRLARGRPSARRRRSVSRISCASFACG